MTIDPELLALLVCPACRTPLRYEPSPERLVCDACGRAYPVRDGIPILLLDEAERRTGFDSAPPGP